MFIIDAYLTIVHSIFALGLYAQLIFKNTGGNRPGGSALASSEYEVSKKKNTWPTPAECLRQKEWVNFYYIF